MRIVQIVLSGASWYERKSQRADRGALSPHHEVLTLPVEEARESAADVAHVYASGAIPERLFSRFPIPVLATAELQRPRWSLRRTQEPKLVATPQNLPEVVEDAWFESARAAGSERTRNAGEPYRVASFARASTRNAVEQSMARIHRFRDDVVWELFSEPPGPEDLARVDLWSDPSVDESDYDGFVAEALVLGLPVVAARTRVNALRLEEGRTGFLVPPDDPNEMTHAILSALFKRERAQEKLAAARQTASKFRARQRIRVLTRMYENLIE